MQLTLADFQGIIVILLIVFIVISIVKKAAKFGIFCLSILCLMQVGFMLSKTDLNDKIPLDQYFKYDIVGSITQIWEDTDKEALKEDISNAADTVTNTAGQVVDGVKDYLDNSKTSEEVSESIEEVPIVDTSIEGENTSN